MNYIVCKIVNDVFVPDSLVPLSRDGALLRLAELRAEQPAETFIALACMVE